MNPLRVALVGGRSGGHIYPLIAVAKALAARCPAEVRFIGEAGRMEEELVPREGYELRTLAIPPAAPAWRRLVGLPRWLGLFGEAKRLLADQRPAVVVGSGGQVCAPVLLAARRLGIPSILLEPNAVPGAAARFIARRARPDRIGLQIERAADRLPAELRIEPIGYPVRPEVLSAERGPACERLGLDPAATTLLVFGGSQGSGRINDALVELLPRLRGDWCAGLQVMHVGGWVNARTVADAEVSNLSVRYVFRAYLHEMADALAAADLVLGRAGAAGLSELTCRGLPALLVPLPRVSDDHQRHNAEWMAAAGAALLVPDAELTAERLEAELRGLLGEPGRLAAMAAASRSLGRPEAADRVVDWVLELALGSSDAGTAA